MAVNFPDSPTLNDTFTSGSRTYVYDGTAWRLQVSTAVLSGSLSSDLVPTSNEAYDLGSVDNRFRDIYLSGNSIDLGGATITSNGSAVTLPVGSNIDDGAGGTIVAATTTYVDTAVAGIVDTAPETLNTLNELAAALGDDANFATTVTNALANKVDTTTLSSYATTTYVDTAIAGAGTGDSIGTTPTKVGAVHDLDYSTGNVFNIDITGDSNIIRLSNPDPISTFKIALNGVEEVQGNYQLESPSTLSTTSYPIPLDPNNYRRPSAGLQFSPDGTRILVGGVGSTDGLSVFSFGVIQFVLNTPWDISSGFSASGSKWNSYPASVGGTTWADNGSSVWHVSFAGSSYYFSKYTFSTPYTFGLSQSFGAPSNTGVGSLTPEPKGIWSGRPGVTNYYLVSDNNGTLVQKSTIGSNTAVKSVTLSTVGGPSYLWDMDMSPDGTQLIGVGGTTVYHWTLSTPWDISTMESIPTTYAAGGNVSGVAFGENGQKVWVMRTGANFDTERAMLEIEPTLFVASPDYTFESIDVYGGIPNVTHNSKTYLEVSTYDTGSTYYVLGATDSGGSDGKILAEYSSLCNGSAIGNVFTQNVTAALTIPESYTDATGSVIAGFIPPTGTTKIVYEYTAHLEWDDAHAMTHWKLFYSTNGSSWTEVTEARTNRNGQYAEDKTTLKWVFELGANTEIGAQGILSDVNPTLWFKWQLRDYGTSNERGKLHQTNYWDGTSGSQFSLPMVTLRCIS